MITMQLLDATATECYNKERHEQRHCTAASKMQWVSVLRSLQFLDLIDHLPTPVLRRTPKVLQPHRVRLSILESPFLQAEISHEGQGIHCVLQSKWNKLQETSAIHKPGLPQHQRCTVHHRNVPQLMTFLHAECWYKWHQLSPVHCQHASMMYDHHVTPMRCIQATMASK